MSVMRIGTRGSELARRQTEWVSQRLRESVPGVDVRTTVIKTHGDVAKHDPVDSQWPVGGFVGAIEQALLRREIDVAVHSHKDLPTAETVGLVVAAIPLREVAHDVLVTRSHVELRALPAGFRVGTGSPRRAAQIRRLGDVEIVPIRGNVPTRIAMLESDRLDAVVLAAAGLARLAVNPPYRIDLPVDEFVPAPAQGALAVQAWAGSDAVNVVRSLDDPETRRAVTAERAFLDQVGGGCQKPVGALAVMDGAELALRGQLLTPDGSRHATGVEHGSEPVALGRALALRLSAELA